MLRGIDIINLARMEQSLSRYVPPDTNTAKVTQFGFDWGPAKVERICQHRGEVIMAVKTPRQELEIRVTPSGLIRTRVVQRKREKR